MMIAQYGHRLPANYDIALIRERAKQLAPRWDDVPDLLFKAFLLRERGRDGAAASSYSSFYLWRGDDGFRDFLIGGRFDVVVDSFGRPEVDTRTVLDARRGRGDLARFAYREEIDIPIDADLHAAYAAEIERNRQVAARPGTVVSAVGLDTKTWRVTRFLVTQDAQAEAGGTRYEVLYLAKPLLDTLPQEQAG
jgi:Domain of unknown function (DUF4865)